MALFTEVVNAVLDSSSCGSSVVMDEIVNPSCLGSGTCRRKDGCRGDMVLLWAGSRTIVASYRPVVDMGDP